MSTSTRRSFLRNSAACLAAAGAATTPFASLAAEATPRFTLCLSPGSIGVSASPSELLSYAHHYGFTSVEPYGELFAGGLKHLVDEITAALKSRGLVWGAAGLPVEFRQDEAKFTAGLRQLPAVAAALQRVGATRVGTWIMPGHGALTYVANLKAHATRLREVANVLQDHNLKLGLEYVGTPNIWRNQRYPFVHTLAETKDLIAAIGASNVGVVLDSWHWTMAGDTAADLLTLRNEDIVSVDLNDAPAGIPKDQQQDGRRELPCATGVIDVATFLKTLVKIGYDGPIRCEPFNKAVNDLDDDAACSATIAALKKAVALL